jgi:hypothetical protein
MQPRHRRRQAEPRPAPPQKARLVAADEVLEQGILSSGGRPGPVSATAISPSAERPSATSARRG